jgi:ATP-dependent exoDNAse (exonuclease V) beta subunit
LKWTIFDTSKSNILWAPYKNKAEGIDAIIPLRLEGKMKHSDFSGLYKDEAVMAYLDALNVLYVAFTRAEEILWGLLPFQKEPKGIFIQNFLQQYIEMIGGGSAAYDTDTMVFELGSWPKKPPQSISTAPMVPLRWEYQTWAELLQVRDFAGDFSESGLEGRRKREFGSLIHGLLEKTSSQNEVMLGLQELYFQGSIDAQEKEVVQAQLDALFENPLFGSWFSGKSTVMAEQGIILPGGQQKRPDRIVMGKDSVEIIDFKTGEPREKYLTQVREYMAIVGKMTELPAKGYICYLETGEIQELV